jgi:hypothetical protein
VKPTEPQAKHQLDLHHSQGRDPISCALIHLNHPTLPAAMTRACTFWPLHIGARVSALAGPNQVLVSSTLRDLVIGSGLEFEERGAHTLKGVPGVWHLFAVAFA